MVRSGPILLAVAALAGCDWFDDPTPTDVRLRVNGDAGETIELVLSTQFVVGLSEGGVTQVQLFLADTLVRPLPIDTVISIALQRRFFTEIAPLDQDAAAVRVQVSVDERGLFDETGDIVASSPFRYVYAFNQPTTRVIEVF